MEKIAANTPVSIALQMVKNPTDLEINSTDDTPLFATIERWIIGILVSCVKKP